MRQLTAREAPMQRLSFVRIQVMTDIREGRKRGVQIALFFQLGNSGMSGTESIRRVRFASRLNAEYRKRLFLIAKQIDIRQPALACNKAEISGLHFHNRQNPGL
ncbi:MAG: hypothetical protein ACYCT9_12340 [Leptospirillum sp.]